MTEYKKSIVFDAPTTPLDETIELTSQRQFDSENDHFSLIEIDNENEDDIEEIQHKRKKHWGWRTLGLAGLGLVGWQTVDHVLSAVASGDMLSIGWSAFVAGVALMGGAVIVREFISLRRLNGLQDERTKIQTIINANGIGKAKAICEHLSKERGRAGTLTAGYDKWQHALASTHNDRDVFELYEQMVVKEQDVIAQKMIRTYSAQAALMVALSPLAIADMILVAWRNFRLIQQISLLYGVRLGTLSKITLLRMIFANMALAGASEAITDIGLDLLSVDLAGRLSTRAAQGLGIGLLTAKLGYKAMVLMRPLPYISTRPPKISDMRKQLLSTLSSKNKD